MSPSRIATSGRVWSTRTLATLGYSLRSSPGEFSVVLALENSSGVWQHQFTKAGSARRRSQALAVALISSCTQPTKRAEQAQGCQNHAGRFRHRSQGEIRVCLELEIGPVDAVDRANVGDHGWCGRAGSADEELSAIHLVKRRDQ